MRLTLLLLALLSAGCDQVAGVFYPKNEAGTRDNLDAMRIQLDDFAQRNRGKPALSIGEAVQHVSAAETGRHLRNDAVINACTDGKDAHQLQDTGGWAYCGNPKDENWGKLVVDCTHEDSAGKPWYSY
jgi:hypothetical protein